MQLSFGLTTMSLLEHQEKPRGILG